ncbi:MAG: hypothetical protein GOVbin2006_2 [Prokaryotic dsDNA virus sp.]|nr:MAG: hypothetical protein GOVbin2006_2 [Prokaryotic dsDNA virus sp.]|tara:strand:- start:2507 stop:3436 length:930 start_codon:yes stop_codon:yes gene_type:complete
MATTFSTSSNFTGKAAGFYISAALKEANSLQYLTSIENIKFKSNLQKMAASDVVKDANCNFDPQGTLALTETQLVPKNLQVNMDLCKDTLLDSWEALQMRAGAGAPPPASFTDYVISYLGGIIAEQVENNIWSGQGASAGEFEGLTTATTGAFAVAANTQNISAGGTFISGAGAGNIITELQAVTTSLAANVPNIINKDDLHIYVSPKTYSLYIQAISAAGYVNAYQMNGDYKPVFEGYKLAVCNGFQNDQIVAAQSSNLYFGTDLLSDQTRINVMDMANLDGSDNIRIVAKYSGGTQVGLGDEVVWNK